MIDRYIVDFLCPSKALIVEVDGETHDSRRDGVRDNRLAELGYRVLRFTNAEVGQQIEGVITTTGTALDTLPDRWAGRPHPNPSKHCFEPEGEGLPTAHREGAKA
ncbi:hypothetical protein SPAN111604_13675 [Sphingomonas antarctica]